MSGTRKTRPWISWQDDSYYMMGKLRIGHKLIPVFTLLMIWIVIGGLEFFVGFIVGSITDNVVFLIPLFIHFMISTVVGIIVGLIALVRWIWGSIEDVREY